MSFKMSADVTEQILSYSDMSDFGLATVLEFVKKYGADSPKHVKELGHIHSSLHPTEPLVIFCYTKEAAWARVWTPAERVCRGLIINYLTAKVVARPFDKFFNVGEMPLDDIGNYINSEWYSYSITEKLDGSLGIIYKLPSTGKLAVATKGSFVSEQAMWATDWLNYHNPNLDEFEQFNQGIRNPLALMAEIIYPENSRDLVIKYGDREGLTLITGRWVDGDELWRENLIRVADDMGLPYVQELTHLTVTDLQRLAKSEAGIEGWVIEFRDGADTVKRFKIKTEDYLRLHKLISNCTPKVIRDTMVMGYDKFLDYMVQLPEEFRVEASRIGQELLARAERHANSIATAWAEVAPIADTSRRDFAVTVNTKYKHHARYLFALLDDKIELDKLVYKVLADLPLVDDNLEVAS